MANSYNGWPASQSPKSIDVVPFAVNGVIFPNGVKEGAVHYVLSYVARRFFAEVEGPVDPGCWGYNYRRNRNANNLSCHASGTAIDLNAPKHPNGKRGTFTAKQTKAIRAILADCDDLIRWGEDFAGTPDGMHFEVNGTPQQIAALANKLAAAATPKPAPPAQPKEWTDMATKDELREVIAEEIEKAKTEIIAKAHADAIVLLRGTSTNSHPYNLTNIGKKLGIQ